MRLDEEIRFPGSPRLAAALGTLLLFGGFLVWLITAVATGLPENPEPARLDKVHRFEATSGELWTMLAPGPLMFLIALFCRRLRYVLVAFTVLAAVEIATLSYLVG